MQGKQFAVIANSCCCCCEGGLSVCVCVQRRKKKREREIEPVHSLPLFFFSPPPLRCPTGGGEVMYRPSYDRTTQQNRWTERGREGQKELEVYCSRQNKRVMRCVCRLKTMWRANMLFLVILKAKNQSVHVYTPAW